MPGYSAKQMKLAQVAKPRDKLNEKDFSMLHRNRKKKDMKNVRQAQQEKAKREKINDGRVWQKVRLTKPASNSADNLKA